MKVLGILIISVLFSVSIMAQQGTYTRIFSGTSYDEGIAAFRLPNKEIRLIGNTGSFGHGSTDVWLIALDSSGNFLWHKFYSGPDVEKANAAIMTDQGDIFLVGSTTQDQSKSYQLFFMGLDQYGQVIAQKNYGGQNWDFGYGICQIDDTTFALVGETYSKGAGESDVFLLKVNRQGDTLWTKTFGGTKEDRGRAVKLMPDSGLMIVGTSKSFGNGSFDSYMLRFDAMGDTLWTKVVPHISDAEFLSFAINPDTSIVCSGYQSDTLNTYRDVNVVKFNQEGNQIWSAASHLSEGEDAYATSIFREHNGDYTYCGITTKYSSTQFPDVRVTRINSTGWWDASRRIGFDKEDVGNMISIDDFQGKYYFLMGTTKNFGVNRSGVLFIRLDSTFHYDTTRIINTPTNIDNYQQSGAVKIYPNPVVDVLSIDLPTNKSDYTVKVYDITGSLLLFTKIPANTRAYKLSVQGLATGVYQITISNKQLYLQSRFIKTLER
jgi:hypothetical protein